MKSFDKTARGRMKVREHLSSPRPHDADFGNGRVVEGSAQEPKRAMPEMLPLQWIAWSGAFSLLLATALTALVLPQQAGGRSDGDFRSQVISARAELPKLSVSAFQAPDQRGVVIWIEGTDYIPAEAGVR